MPKQTSLYFFGTHQFGASILLSLINDDRYNVLGVVTQPDRPVGRKKVMQAPPVKLVAVEHNITVFQPARLKQFEIEHDIDVAVVAQYGNLIPKRLLDHPKHGMINVHTSLLPKYRGASPIQSALINGDATTGVTIMNMDVGMDTGNILTQKEIAIKDDWTYLDLDSALAIISGPLLVDTVSQYIDGSITPQVQDEALVSHCSQLTRDAGKVDWSDTANNIYNKYRGLTPWPGLWTMWQGKRIKLHKISLSEVTVAIGEVKKIENIVHIGTSNGSITIQNLQIEGKPAMDIDVFVNGYKDFVGGTTND